MEGKALRFVGDNIEQVRTPLHRREEFHEMEKHPEALKGKTHKEQISHVSTLLSVTEKTAEALLEAKELVWKASYIDIDDVTDAEEGTFLSSTADDPSLLHDQIELKKVTATMLDMLTPREAKILRMHYGIDMVDEKESTLDEIGEEIGVTRERVRQIEIRAVRKLRHPSRHEKLVPWTNPKQQK